MSGTPYIPIEYSRLGPMDLAFESANNVVPFALGPCSQAIEIFGRHESQCWGSFPSQWVNQKDSSASCVWEYKLKNITAHYTEPRTNLVTKMSGLSPVEQAEVQEESVPQPSCGRYPPGSGYPKKC